MDIPMEVLTDLLRHRAEVQANLQRIINDLSVRGVEHDLSKLEAVEFDPFVESRPIFRKANYGSPEYEEATRLAKSAVEHHYKTNRHHPAYHPNRINSMNLMDMCEMLADWKAAARRSPDLSFADSLYMAFEKHNIGPQLGAILFNTMVELGWIGEAPYPIRPPYCVLCKHCVRPEKENDDTPGWWDCDAPDGQCILWREEGGN